MNNSAITNTNGNRSLVVFLDSLYDSQGGSMRISEGWGVNLIILPYLLYIFGQTGLSKQCRRRSDAAERGVWSGSILFATHTAILHIFTGSKIDLLKRCIRKGAHNLSNYPKFPMKMSKRCLTETPPPPTPPSHFSKSAPDGSAVYRNSIVSALRK